MDPLQFAYQPRIGVEDAIIYLLHSFFAQLEKAGSTVRIMFFDLSSAFNTIRPTLLGSKLESVEVDQHLITWIMESHKHATVCESRGQCLRQNTLQHEGTKGNSPCPIPLHPLHCRLHPQHHKLPATDIL